MAKDATEVSADELAKLQFLRGVPQDGRVIAATSYFDQGGAFSGLIDLAGQVIVLPNTQPTWGAYWSKSLIAPCHDAYFRLLDLVAQHYSYSSVLSSLRAVELDLGHVVTTVEKFFAIFDYSESPNAHVPAIRLMYLTELEYLFGVCRSLIDLLHDCYRHIHRKNGGTELPDTFGRFVDKDVADLVKKYKLPPQTENYLNNVKPLFGMIRQVRDGIYHKGKSLERIFLTADGPGICIEDPPFDPFKLVLDGDADYERTMMPNKVGSLFYLVMKIADLMIAATNQLADTLTAVFPMPPAYVKDGFQYFVRGPNYCLLASRQQLMKAYWLRPAREMAASMLANRTVPQPAFSDESRTDWIARNAYFRWINAGRPHGRHDEHWWDAEREYICTVFFRQKRLDSFSAAHNFGT